MPGWLAIEVSVGLQKGRGEVGRGKRGGVRGVRWGEGKCVCVGGGGGASRGKRLEV